MHFRFVKKIPALPVKPGMCQDNREAENDFKAHSSENLRNALSLYGDNHE